MNHEIIKREYPILGISCPVCGSVFSVHSLSSKFFKESDHEENARFSKEIIDYAEQGLNIKVYSSKNEYKFHYCEHVKNRIK